jgi:hypothetical protein
MGTANAKITWSGDFETGDFTQWHGLSGTKPIFSLIPEYCRPTSGGGDGSCLSVETKIVRQGKYAAKFTLKNSQNGEEPRDCDVPFPTCARRRSQLTALSTQPVVYNAMPYMGERWLSVSHYVPANWDDGGSGWGINVFEIKGYDSHAGGYIAINIHNGHWKIMHRWDDAVRPTYDDVPWQQQMFYTPTYPAPDGSDSGADLRADFPNQRQSQAALADLNKGGWTDWVIHVKNDARGSRDGGTGFLEIWKRTNTDPWVKVLDIRPRMISRGGLTFDRGIGYHDPDGFGMVAGMYTSKEQVWGLPENRTLYLDNIRLADENGEFSSVSPDGSAPGVAIAPPAAPTNVSVK